MKDKTQPPLSHNKRHIGFRRPSSHKLQFHCVTVSILGGVPGNADSGGGGKRSWGVIFRDSFKGFLKLLSLFFPKTAEIQKWIIPSTSFYHKKINPQQTVTKNHKQLWGYEGDIGKLAISPPHDESSLALITGTIAGRCPAQSAGTRGVYVKVGVTTSDSGDTMWTGVNLGVLYRFNFCSLNIHYGHPK